MLFKSLITVLTAGACLNATAQDASAAPEAPAPQPAEQKPYIPDGKTIPPVEKIDDASVRIGKVIVNHQERTVSFKAVVNMEKGILEYICCMPNGKLHESLLVSDADPLHMSVGMALLKFNRFEKFFPQRDENFEWLPFTEPKPEDYASSRLQVSATYKIDGKEHTTDFSDLIINARTGDPLPATEWLYTNSFFYEGSFQASMTGEIISIFASRTSIINYIGDFNAGANDSGWVANPANTLPVGTELTITISQKPAPAPAPEQKPAQPEQK